jgi:NitT/TauT family transport system permease protein
VTPWPFAVAALAVLAIVVARRLAPGAQRVVLPLAAAAILLAAWHLAAQLGAYEVASTGRRVAPFPTPWETARGMADLLADGRVLRYAVASLYRVANGFLLAAAIGIPLGLWAGWSTRAFWAINPLVQGLRPISPIAWIPIAILWFGVKDGCAIFVIFLSSFFPIVTGTTTAVRTIPLVYVRSAQNFGLGGLELFRRVVFPAALPQIVTSLRIALGIAWLVVVAAEMIAVTSGLGFLVNDARNMGMRYDLVLGAMVCIGLIGIALDLLIRRLEHFDEVRWGFPEV